VPLGVAAAGEGYATCGGDLEGLYLPADESPMSWRSCQGRDGCGAWVGGVAEERQAEGGLDRAQQRVVV
jgi:hypothetical protein